MEDVVEKFIRITKKMGGPDYATLKLFKESKYGINKKRSHLFPQLECDPVFNDVVDWMADSFDSTCVLKPSLIHNYWLITNSEQRVLFEEGVELLDSTDSQPDDTIEDLVEQVSSLEILFQLVQKRNNTLKHQETFLVQKQQEIHRQLVEKHKFNIDLIQQLKYDSNCARLAFSQFVTALKMSHLKEFNDEYSLSKNKRFMMHKYTFFRDLDIFRTIDLSKMLQHVSNYSQSLSERCKYVVDVYDTDIQKMIRNMSNLVIPWQTLQLFADDMLKLQIVHQTLNAELIGVKSAVKYICNNMHEIHNGSAIEIRSDIVEMNKYLDGKYRSLINEISGIFQQEYKNYIQKSIAVELVENSLKSNNYLVTELKNVLTNNSNILKLFNFLLEWSIKNHDNVEWFYTNVKNVQNIVDFNPVTINKEKCTKNSLSPYFLQLIALYCHSFNQFIPDNYQDCIASILDSYQRSTLGIDEIVANYDQKVIEKLAHIKEYLRLTFNVKLELLPTNTSLKYNEFLRDVDKFVDKIEDVFTEYEWRKDLVENDKKRSNLLNKIKKHIKLLELKKTSIRDYLNNVMEEKFPFKINSAFAYGSAVFQQKNDDASKNMVDVVLIVDDEIDFHTNNLLHNSRDYSIVGKLGPRFIKTMFHDTSAGIYFNPFCTFKQRQLKYGVISRYRIIQDLVNWPYLYVAGRLHKPVLWLQSDAHDCGMKEAVEQNLENSIRVALMRLPPKFDEASLFLKICDISYEGDVRRWFNIDVNKSKNIVETNLKMFQNLYCPTLRTFGSVLYSNGTQFEQDSDPMTVLASFNKLPMLIRNNAVELAGRKRDQWSRRDCDVVKRCTREAINRVVRYSSICQTIKGLPSSGFSKTIMYITSKFTKSFT